MFWIVSFFSYYRYHTRFRSKGSSFSSRRVTKSLSRDLRSACVRHFETYKTRKSRKNCFVIGLFKLTGSTVFVPTKTNMKQEK